MSIVNDAKDIFLGLRDKGCEIPDNVFWELLSFSTGLSKQRLCLDDVPSNFSRSESISKFKAAVDSYASSVPLQYITGIAYFRNLELSVNESVLIPRPETEILVDIATTYLREGRIAGKDACLADICTGSGCIAISCARELGSSVFATDISKDALEVARLNCTTYGVDNKCMFFEGNLCDPLIDKVGEFDVVLSNPPYVPASVYENLPLNVKNYEPEIALLAGDDGCKYMRELSWGAHILLKPGGMFACEIHDENSYDFKQIAERAGFISCEIVDDLTGRPRFVVAYNPS